jgi:intein/homing endonuclease
VTALVSPDEEELYLLSILDGTDGIDLAEFCWVDEETNDGCFRAWDFQWAWYTCEDTLQIDQCGRALGKSNGIAMRAFAFPFCWPGQDMLLTAPELNHLRPIVDLVESKILETRLANELLPKTKGRGISRQPHWQARFANGSKIISRLPNKDGKGIKGCVAGDVLVTTERGQVRADEIVVGDYVLTDAGRYMPVLHVYSEEVECVTVAGAGHRGLTVSEDHRLLNDRLWAIPEPGHRWATPTSFPELELPDLPAGCTDGVAMLALAGRWVADGNLGVRGAKVVHAAITVKDAEFETVRLLFKGAGYDPVEREHDGTARCLVVHSTALATWLREHFGHLAQGKGLPSWLLGAPVAARDAFLQGYLSGDGHWNVPKQRWDMGTASKPLAIGLRLLAQSLGFQAAYSWVDPQHTHVMGVALKAQPHRAHRVYITDHGRSVVRDGMRFGRVRSVQPTGVRRVYDLVVAEDHSYLADGIVSKGSPWLPDGTEV